MKKNLVISTIAAIAAQNPEGYTVNAATLQPITSGYAVALAVTQDSFGAKGLEKVVDVIDKMQNQGEAFRFDSLAFGGWYDTKSGRYYYYLNANDGKAFVEMLDGKKKVVKKVKTWEDVRDAWARSLVRKSENAVTFEEAQQMAEEKVDYKNDRISAMISRQFERGDSVKRGKLIAKMERENPLRPIKDYVHALAIIAASKRHNNTTYDNLLSEAHDMELYGDIEPGTAKEWAREQIKKTKQIINHKL